MTSILSQIQARRSLVDTEDVFDLSYKERSTKFEDDPLVISISLKQLVETTGNHTSLDDPNVIANITPSTRELAEQIRKYYGKKFFWNNLTNARPLTDFRTRVCYLLENRVRTCNDRDLGIYYKLPYFYEEDMIYNEFKQQYNTTDIPAPNWILTNSYKRRSKERLTLKYIKSTSCRQNKRNVNRFWFTNGTYLYSIQITNDNPLLEMFKQLVIDRVEVTFETYYNVDRIDQMHFYKLFNFSLAKETNA